MEQRKAKKRLSLAKMQSKLNENQTKAKQLLDIRLIFSISVTRNP